MSTIPNIFTSLLMITSLLIQINFLRSENLSWLSTIYEVSIPFKFCIEQKNFLVECFNEQYLLYSHDIYIQWIAERLNVSDIFKLPSSSQNIQKKPLCSIFPHSSKCIKGFLNILDYLIRWSVCQEVIL